MVFTATAIVFCAALFLVLLAFASFFAPRRATVFLNGFAASLRAHLTEMLLRLMAGASLIIASGQMAYSQWFHLFGWLIVISSIVLLLIPWRWHKKFADIVVPPMTKRVWVFGLFSLPLGLVILFGLLSENL
jgi:hypothetical protein